jgi:hypothetical protein
MLGAVSLNVSPHHAAASTTLFYQMCEPLSAHNLSWQTLLQHSVTKYVRDVVRRVICRLPHVNAI